MQECAKSESASQCFVKPTALPDTASVHQKPLCSTKRGKRRECEKQEVQGEVQTGVKSSETSFPSSQMPNEKGSYLAVIINSEDDIKSFIREEHNTRCPASNPTSTSAPTSILASTSASAAVPTATSGSGEIASCGLCQKGGDLVQCTECRGLFHKPCAGMYEIAANTWRCHECP